MPAQIKNEVRRTFFTCKQCGEKNEMYRRNSGTPKRFCDSCIRKRKWQAEKLKNETMLVLQ